MTTTSLCRLPQFLHLLFTYFFKIHKLYNVLLKTSLPPPLLLFGVVAMAVHFISVALGWRWWREFERYFNLRNCQTKLYFIHTAPPSFPFLLTRSPFVFTLVGCGALILSSLSLPSLRVTCRIHSPCVLHTIIQKSEPNRTPKRTHRLMLSFFLSRHRF